MLAMSPGGRAEQDSFLASARWRQGRVCRCRGRKPAWREEGPDGAREGGMLPALLPAVSSARPPQVGT